MIYIYTDGAAKGNPGPGGYGIILQYGVHKKELKGGYRRTTNNRMELLAVIKGLEAIKQVGHPVTIVSDSKYVVNAVKKRWLWKWQKKGFKKKANVDLWKKFIPLYRNHQPDLVWVKGHAGHIENERCDQLAVEAAIDSSVSIDEGYERKDLIIPPDLYV